MNHRIKHQRYHKRPPRPFHYTRYEIIFYEPSAVLPEVFYLYHRDGIIVVYQAYNQYGEIVPDWFVADHDNLVFHRRKNGEFRQQKPSYAPLRPSCKHGSRNYLYMRGMPGSPYLHVIICGTFHGAKPAPHYQCDHRDGNPLNNNADNLEWVTPEENTRRRVEKNRKENEQFEIELKKLNNLTA